MKASRLALVTLLGWLSTACAQVPAPRGPSPRAEREAALRTQLEQLRADLVAREALIHEVSIGEAKLDRRLRDTTQLNDEIARRLERTSKSLERLAAERQSLLEQLTQAHDLLELLAEVQMTVELDPPADTTLAIEEPEDEHDRQTEVAVIPEPE